MIIDTHCHLQFSELSGEIISLLGRAKSAGINHIINVGTDVETSQSAIALAGRYDELSATVGLHPHEASSLDIAAMQELYVLARHPKVVAIGEIGLDYFRLAHAGKFAKSPTMSEQQAVFEKLLDTAVELDLAVIIHSREAAQDVFEICKGYQGKIRGVLHAFSYDWVYAKTMLELGYYISFAGNLTYPKNDHLHEVAKQIPMDRLLVETDSPYLPPEQYRGKTNEPSWIVHTVEYLAQLKNVDRAVIERQTTANARNLFGI